MSMKPFYHESLYQKEGTYMARRAARFTIGIEEELQLVDRLTGQLVPKIHSIIEKGQSLFGEQLKPEMLQSTAELITDVCPDIKTARQELSRLRSLLTRLATEEGVALISAGTHPSALWMNQLRSLSSRYEELEEEFQDVGRSVLIFGLHVHIGVEDRELAVSLLNQLRTWLPHLLALSSNSPFWLARYTGLRSYRAIVWKRFPRSGVPDPLLSWSDFENYVETLVKAGCIDNGKRVWWDIRPHAFFNTIEFRVFDMPATFEDTIALSALCQALVAKLAWLHQQGLTTPIVPRNLIEENKWRAARYGLDAEVVDFARERRLSMRDSIHELLDFVDEVVDDLGTRHEMNHLRHLLADPRGTGADRQIAIYKETHSLQAVTHFLMQQTREGIENDPISQQAIS
jgi:glutamate---cysteine ligase / carboxylate-amine ligase